MAKKKADKEPKFEQRLARLEEIVAQLESGEAGLDESMQLYAEGAELVKACRKTLLEAERKITRLTEDAAGNLKEEPFEPAEDDSEKA